MHPADMAELGSRLPENVAALEWREVRKNGKGIWSLWFNGVEIPIRNVRMHITPCPQGDERKGSK